ncbi:MAG: MFS transporter [Chloroflexi bacterium]|nr:MFS transporter [Chloroflexota bacterium]
MNPFMVTAVNVALPLVARELALDTVALGWVTTVYLTATVVFIVPCGRLADIYGRRRLFLIGVVGYIVSSLLCALAPSAEMLIGFRALQGVSNALVAGTSMALLTTVYPTSERGFVLGLYVTAVYSGQTVGPFIGGTLAQTLGWRSIFATTALVGLVVLALSLWKLRTELVGAQGERFDLGGSLIYAVTVVALLSGFSLVPQGLGYGLALAGVVGIAAFVWWEKQVGSPLVDVDLFHRNRVFGLSLLAALLAYSATFAVSFVLSLYLQIAKGISPQAAGSILLFQPIMQAVVSPFAGRLSDRMEPRFVAAGGMAIITTGLAMLATLHEDTPLPFIVGSLMLLGLGFGLFSSPNQNAIMSAVERRSYGVASSLVGAGRVAGQALSMALVSLIFALLVGRVQLTHDVVDPFLRGSRIAFVIFAALCLTNVVISLARGNLRQAGSGEPVGSEGGRAH